jgi:hypothetical protein
MNHRSTWRLRNPHRERAKVFSQRPPASKFEALTVDGLKAWQGGAR